MDDSKIDVCEGKQPLGLTAVEVLGLLEVCQVFVVSEDLYRKGGSMEIVSQGFEGVNDGKEFPVIDVIAPLSGDEGLGEV